MIPEQKVKQEGLHAVKQKTCSDMDTLKTVLRNAVTSEGTHRKVFRPQRAKICTEKALLPVLKCKEDDAFVYLRYSLQKIQKKRKQNYRYESFTVVGR